MTRMSVENADGILQFAEDNKMVLRRISEDNRFIVFHGIPEAKYSKVICDATLEPLATRKRRGYCPDISPKAIDDYIHDKSVYEQSLVMTEHIHLFRDGIKHIAQIDYDHHANTKFMNTLDGMFCIVDGSEITLYNTRWLWRDFALQDNNVQKIAITAAIALKRTCEHIIGRRIIHKIVRMVMEG